jgi:uncharacterized metal-binding protein YceD (DUF177 family)
MSDLIPLRRPGAEVGARHETHATFEVEPFDLYGRHHEVTEAEADVAVTRLAEGLHLDLRARLVVRTSCDRTLEPTELRLELDESEFLPCPENSELSIEDWALDLAGYTRHALPSEVPMQVFCPGTEPVEPSGTEDEIDPRWRGLGGLFASNF